MVVVCVQTAWLAQQCDSYSAITRCAATYATYTSRLGTLEIPRGSPVGFVARLVFLYTFLSPSLNRLTLPSLHRLPLHLAHVRCWLHARCTDF